MSSATWMPAARNDAKPRPSTRGSGSLIAATTRATPESMIVWVQGGVRP